MSLTELIVQTRRSPELLDVLALFVVTTMSVAAAHNWDTLVDRARAYISGRVVRARRRTLHESPVTHDDAQGQRIDGHSSTEPFVNTEPLQQLDDQTLRDLGIDVPEDVEDSENATVEADDDLDALLDSLTTMLAQNTNDSQRQHLQRALQELMTIREDSTRPTSRASHISSREHVNPFTAAMLGRGRLISSPAPSTPASPLLFGGRSPMIVARTPLIAGRSPLFAAQSSFTLSGSPLLGRSPLISPRLRAGRMLHSPSVSPAALRAPPSAFGLSSSLPPITPLSLPASLHSVESNQSWNVPTTGHGSSLLLEFGPSPPFSQSETNVLNPVTAASQLSSTHPPSPPTVPLDEPALFFRTLLMSPTRQQSFPIPLSPQAPSMPNAVGTSTTTNDAPLFRRDISLEEMSMRMHASIPQPERKQPQEESDVWWSDEEDVITQQVSNSSGHSQPQQNSKRYPDNETVAAALSQGESSGQVSANLLEQVDDEAGSISALPLYSRVPTYDTQGESMSSPLLPPMTFATPSPTSLRRAESITAFPEVAAWPLLTDVGDSDMREDTDIPSDLELEPEPLSHGEANMSQGSPISPSEELPMLQPITSPPPEYLNDAQEAVKSDPALADVEPKLEEHMPYPDAEQQHTDDAIDSQSVEAPPKNDDSRGMASPTFEDQFVAGSPSLNSADHSVTHVSSSEDRTHTSDDPLTPHPLVTPDRSPAVASLRGSATPSPQSHSDQHTADFKGWSFAPSELPRHRLPPLDLTGISSKEPMDRAADGKAALQRLSLSKADGISPTASQFTPLSAGFTAPPPRPSAPTPRRSSRTIRQDENVIMEEEEEDAFLFRRSDDREPTSAMLLEVDETSFDSAIDSSSQLSFERLADGGELDLAHSAESRQLQFPPDISSTPPAQSSQAVEPAFDQQLMNGGAPLDRNINVLDGNQLSAAVSADDRELPNNVLHERVARVPSVEFTAADATFDTIQHRMSRHDDFLSVPASRVLLPAQLQPGVHAFSGDEDEGTDSDASDPGPLSLDQLLDEAFPAASPDIHPILDHHLARVPSVELQEPSHRTSFVALPRLRGQKSDLQPLGHSQRGSTLSEQHSRDMSLDSSSGYDRRMPSDLDEPEDGRAGWQDSVRFPLSSPKTASFDSGHPQFPSDSSKVSIVDPIAQTKGRSRTKSGRFIARVIEGLTPKILKRGSNVSLSVGNASTVPLAPSRPAWSPNASLTELDAAFPSSTPATTEVSSSSQSSSMKKRKRVKRGRTVSLFSSVSSGQTAMTTPDLFPTNELRDSTISVQPDSVLVRENDTDIVDLRLAVPPLDHHGQSSGESSRSRTTSLISFGTEQGPHSTKSRGNSAKRRTLSLFQRWSRADLTSQPVPLPAPDQPLAPVEDVLSLPTDAGQQDRAMLTFPTLHGRQAPARGYDGEADEAGFSFSPASRQDATERSHHFRSVSSRASLSKNSTRSGSHSPAREGTVAWRELVKPHPHVRGQSLVQSRSPSPTRSQEHRHGSASNMRRHSTDIGLRATSHLPSRRTSFSEVLNDRHHSLRVQRRTSISNVTKHGPSFVEERGSMNTRRRTLSTGAVDGRSSNTRSLSWSNSALDLRRSDVPPNTSKIFTVTSPGPGSSNASTPSDPQNLVILSQPSNQLSPGLDNHARTIIPLDPRLLDNSDNAAAEIRPKPKERGRSRIVNLTSRFTRR